MLNKSSRFILINRFFLEATQASGGEHTEFGVPTDCSHVSLCSAGCVQSVGLFSPGVSAHELPRGALSALNVTLFPEISPQARHTPLGNISVQLPLFSALTFTYKGVLFFQGMSKAKCDK